MTNAMKTKNVVPPTDESSSARTFSKARVVAAKRGICSRTVHRWADAGLISRFKVNARVVLFDESELDRLIERSRVSGPITTGKGSAA